VTSRDEAVRPGGAVSGGARNAAYDRLVLLYLLALIALPLIVGTWVAYQFAPMFVARLQRRSHRSE
jgi:hypothetical protein